MSGDRAILAAEIVRASHALHTRGWVANHDGNVSVRLSEGRFLVTPTATSKIDVTEGGLAVTDSSGKPVEGEARPPSEFALHLGAYAERPDVVSVIHAHPPYATAMACAGKSIRTFIAEAVVSIGLGVPLAEFSLPFGEAGAAPIRKLIDRHDALLLCRHGVITVGQSVEQALLRMELVEHLAKIATLARPHGGVRELPPEVLETLLAKRRKAGLGLAAERSQLDSGASGHPGAQGQGSEAPSSWTPAGPPPARDAWSGGATEATCGVVYGAASAASGELESAVQAAIDRHLRGEK